MAQPAKFDELRQHVVVKNFCAISITVLRVQIYKENASYFRFNQFFFLLGYNCMSNFM